MAEVSSLQFGLTPGPLGLIDSLEKIVRRMLKYKFSGDILECWKGLLVTDRQQPRIFDSQIWCFLLVGWLGGWQLAATVRVSPPHQRMLQGVGKLSIAPVVAEEFLNRFQRWNGGCLFTIPLRIWCSEFSSPTAGQLKTGQISGNLRRSQIDIEEEWKVLVSPHSVLAVSVFLSEIS